MLQSAYDLLGVERNATREEITAAYRRAAMRHHPDRNPDDPQATEKFQEIEKAHRLLLKLTPAVRLKVAPVPPPPPPRDAATEEKTPPPRAQESAETASPIWLSLREIDDARRRAHEARRKEKMRKREEELLARSVETPLLSLCALLAAAAAVQAQAFSTPLNLLIFAGLLLLAHVLLPQQPEGEVSKMLTAVIKLIVRLCFVGLFVWSLLPVLDGVGGG